jgi:cardiolipin synthase
MKIYRPYILRLFVLFSVFYTACTNLPITQRVPNSNADLDAVYLNKIDIDLLKERIAYLSEVLKRKKNIKSTERDLNFTTPVETELNQLKSELNKKLSQQKQDTQTNIESSLEPRFSMFQKKWRIAKQNFLLHNMDLYLTPRFRTYEFSEADVVELSLNNYFYSWTHNKGPEDKSQLSPLDQQNNQHYLMAEFSCPGSYKFGSQIKNDGHVEKFYWYDQFNNGQSISVTLDRSSGNCQLRFKNPDTGKIGSVEFKSNTNSMIDQVSYRYESCVQDDVRQLSGPEKFFYGSENSRLTCPVAVTPYKRLPIPQQTLESKIEALIGQKVPKDYLTSRNPFYKFDMSKAPKFDAIFISYLVFRNDLSGRTIAELLKWHSLQGTEVYIMASKVIKTSKDTQMFLDMMAQYPRIHVQEYAYTTRSGLGLKDMFDQLHRTLHVKMFITYSKTDSALNKAWIGGRNIHDGFAFENIPQVNTPDIVDYTKDDTWVFWRDFESIISDQHLVDQMVSQYATLWNRDSETLYVRDTVLNLKSYRQIHPADIDLNHPVARHILTIPYNDDMNLEKFIASMIASAEKEIIFSTPYFRPTKRLSEAFQHAAERGVKIKMITRLNLKGDTLDWLLSDVNKSGVNKFLNQIEMYEYTSESEILHTKVFLIDGKMTFFGGVNLNQRSFYHDLENGILTLGTDFNNEMTQILNTYFAGAKKISEKQKVSFWKKILIGIFDKEF